MLIVQRNTCMCRLCVHSCCSKWCDSWQGPKYVSSCHTECKSLRSGSDVWIHICAYSQTRKLSIRPSRGCSQIWVSCVFLFERVVWARIPKGKLTLINAHPSGVRNCLILYRFFVSISQHTKPPSYVQAKCLSLRLTLELEQCRSEPLTMNPKVSMCINLS